MGKIDEKKKYKQNINKRGNLEVGRNWVKKIDCL